LTAAADTTKAPPAFFVQDPTDSLCLAGEEFKRCSIETLYYVLGEPGRQMRGRIRFDEAMVLENLAAECLSTLVVIALSYRRQVSDPQTRH
jgi:hypothetical protein